MGMLRAARVLGAPNLRALRAPACSGAAASRMSMRHNSSESTMDPEVLDRLKKWTGAMVAAPPRKVHATIDTSHANLYGATMALTEHDPWLKFEEGSPLPPLWHLAYFIESKPTFGLSPDGHPKDIKPPPPFDVRMFAGANITFNTSNPLRCGDKAVVEMYYPAEGVKIKDGNRRGPLVFVEEVRDFWNDTGLCVTERRQVVYMQIPKPAEGAKAASTDAPAKPAPPPVGEDEPKFEWEKRVLPDAALLFRYSALTFNTHKIHYERPYTKEIEKHPDLVVHGPLVAQFLSDELRARIGPDASANIASYKFRLNSPYYVERPITLRGASRYNASGEVEWDVWAVDDRGRTGVKGTITLEGS
ncbi:hypothetical protein DFJ74DRAFT_621222 [Hyaloraphidium curvatum]|nr:hypothetical protein DFJ74DRAFT_621222 [Hyaloraphidium curvatum]